MDEKKAEETGKKQRSIGRPFLPGQSGNPNGRPKGSFSIKELIRQRLQENPQELKSFLDHFVTGNRDLAWRMLEGQPQQTVDQTVHVDKFEITDGDYRPVSGGEIPLAEEDN